MAGENSLKSESKILSLIIFTFVRFLSKQGGGKQWNEPTDKRLLKLKSHYIYIADIYTR